MPRQTLTAEEAHELGIHAEDDLFGGVVPYAFLTTKSLVHPVVGRGVVPPGWSHAFGARLRDTVLDGYTAFTREDARRAGTRVLASGPARLKPGDGIAGRGQTVVANPAELDAAVDALDPESTLRNGVVVEQNLDDVITFSVGRVLVGGLVASYVGTQWLTSDNHDADVYGGSDLNVVRGDFQALLAVVTEPELREAIELALAFDCAVSRAYPGFLASRRNYDVAYGRDAAGNKRFGLLEQSWRLGGASPAEIVALELLRSQPELTVVRVCCVESYGQSVVPPPEAMVYFRGIDELTGPLTKFVYVKDDGSAR